MSDAKKKNVDFIFFCIKMISPIRQTDSSLKPPKTTRTSSHWRSLLSHDVVSLALTW